MRSFALRCFRLGFVWSHRMWDGLCALADRGGKGLRVLYAVQRDGDAQAGGHVLFENVDFAPTALLAARTVRAKLVEVDEPVQRIAEALAPDRTGEYRERLLQKQLEVRALQTRRHQHGNLLAINLLSNHAKKERENPKDPEQYYRLPLSLSGDTID